MASAVLTLKIQNTQTDGDATFVAYTCRLYEILNSLQNYLVDLHVILWSSIQKCATEKQTDSTG